MIRNLSVTFLVAVLCCAPAFAGTFDWATVADPGNLDDNTGYGGVAYTYRISKHEVTNAQYTSFLNAVASTDNFGGTDPTLYDTNMGSSTWGGITRSGSAGSYTYAVKSPAVGQGPGGADYTYDNKPVVYVSFFDAMRFVNWLHNGRGSGDTESGVYSITNGVRETRRANARYSIPSEDEWYKAAYYDPTSGVYYNYPTGTDSVPNNNRPTADTGNSANFNDSGYTTGDRSYPLTDVGAYSLSESPYGTFDQGGNVWEWNEAVISATVRKLRGGSWNLYSFSLEAGNPLYYSPSVGSSLIGFRVASVAEPSVAADFDEDGDVDGEDFLIWQASYKTNADADADGDRDTDGDDFLIWQAAYEPGSGAGAGTAATVPEPATGLLFVAGIVAMAVARGSRGVAGCYRENVTEPTPVTFRYFAAVPEPSVFAPAACGFVVVISQLLRPGHSRR